LIGSLVPAEARAMDKATVIDILKRHEAELRELGIERLSLFGSIARDEATEASMLILLPCLRLVRAGLRAWSG